MGRHIVFAEEGRVATSRGNVDSTWLLVGGAWTTGRSPSGKGRHRTWGICIQRSRLVQGFTRDRTHHDMETPSVFGITGPFNLQHRISATGWLLFMRCVSFTFIRLLPTWTPTEIFGSFWAKHFSNCDFIICPIKSKLRFLKVCKLLKRTWHFQTDWILCVLNCSGCSHVVNDAGSTCSCC